MPELLLINGMWRAATTYLWNKVRQLPEWLCYYEPLHEGLASYDSSLAELWRKHDMWKLLRHPNLSNGYWDEYPLNANGRGVPGYSPAMAYERFILDENETDPALYGYLQELIAHSAALGKKACLQPNRMFLRSRWFVRRFPCFHIYMHRHWWDLWMSMKSFPNRYFLTRFYIIAANNSGHPLIQPLLGDARLAIPRNLAETAMEEPVKEWLENEAEVFRFFYYIYVCSTVMNAAIADFVFDVRAASRPGPYIAEHSLEGIGLRLDLRDCDVPTYDLTGDCADYPHVRAEVDALIRTKLSGLQISASRLAFIGEFLAPETTALLDRFSGPS